MQYFQSVECEKCIVISNVSFVEDWKGLAIYHDSLSGMFCYIGLPRWAWSNSLSSTREFCYRVRDNEQDWNKMLNHTGMLK